MIAAGRRVKELQYCAAFAVRRSVPGAKPRGLELGLRKYWFFQHLENLSRRSWLAQKRVRDQMDA